MPNNPKRKIQTMNGRKVNVEKYVHLAVCGKTGRCKPRCQECAEVINSGDSYWRETDYGFRYCIECVTIEED